MNFKRENKLGRHGRRLVSASPGQCRGRGFQFFQNGLIYKKKMVCLSLRAKEINDLTQSKISRKTSEYHFKSVENKQHEFGTAQTTPGNGMTFFDFHPDPARTERKSALQMCAIRLGSATHFSQKSLMACQ